MKSILRFLMITGILICLVSISCAAVPYRGYTYDSWDDAVPSQIGYEPERVYTGNDFTDIGAFSNPSDLYITQDQQIYILDSGNNRVVIFNQNFELVGVLSEFSQGDQIISLKQPTGIFVDTTGQIYISDPLNHQVIVSDKEGKVSRVLIKPDSNMLEEDLEFLPQKVLVDSAGMVYVTASGIYQGALIYDQQGNFVSFYGSNKVEFSVQMIWDYFWKQLLSEESASGFARYVPEEFSSFDIDERDFLYTVTQTADSTQKVKKLNPVGQNILEAEKFGELENIYVSGTSASSRFVDVAVDKNGSINVLDQQNNRIFQYDREGTLLFIFGGTGQQFGTFLNPCAIDTLDDRILVLDYQKNNLTVFKPTAFGTLVHGAVSIYNDGRYSQAAEAWTQVIDIDHNYEIAYVSLGKALMAENKFKEAAEYFQLGRDREGNSEAFRAYRNQVVQTYFPVVCIVIVILIGLLIWKYNHPSKKKEEKFTRHISPFKFMMHPIDNAEEMKLKRSGSMMYSIIILGVWFIVTVFEYSLTGFRFNLHNPDDTNISLLFLRTVPLFLVWVIANWGVSTLMNGKGRMKEIWISNSYCLIPYIASMLLYVILSYFLVDTELVIMQAILILGIVWSILMLLGVLSGIHEYSFGKTLASVFLSLIGVLVVVFIVLLVTSMLKQAYAFVYAIFNELLYRFR